MDELGDGIVTNSTSSQRKRDVPQPFRADTGNLDVDRFGPHMLAVFRYTGCSGAGSQEVIAPGSAVAAHDVDDPIRPAEFAHHLVQNVKFFWIVGADIVRAMVPQKVVELCKRIWQVAIADAVDHIEALAGVEMVKMQGVTLTGFHVSRSWLACIRVSSPACGPSCDCKHGGLPFPSCYLHPHSPGLGLTSILLQMCKGECVHAIAIGFLHSAQFTASAPDPSIGCSSFTNRLIGRFPYLLRPRACYRRSMLLESASLRVLGCLMEKEMTTPDLYPLSINSLLAAANQRSSRDPVMDLEEDQVRSAVEKLEGLALVAAARDSGRVTKFEHRIRTVLNLRRDETAILCLLFLRGPQTPGELRSRSERMFSFEDLAQVQSTLERLASRGDPLVAAVPRQPGSREIRWKHRLQDEVSDASGIPNDATSVHTDDLRVLVERLSTRVLDLESRLQNLETSWATTLLR